MILRRLLAVAAIALVGLTGAAAARGNCDPTTDRACLTWQTRAILEGAEAHFGRRFELASTCRPCATIRGSGGHASEHRFGKAVDLNVPAGISKSALMRWIYARAGAGVVMSYRNMAHVHFDTGDFHKLIFGADAFPGRRKSRGAVAAAGGRRDGLALSR